MSTSGFGEVKFTPAEGIFVVFCTSKFLKLCQAMQKIGISRRQAVELLYHTIFETYKHMNYFVELRIFFQEVGSINL